MPAPPKEELLRISRSVQIKLPPRGSWQSHQALPERVRPAQDPPAAKFPHAKTARPPRVRGSLAGSSFYGLHACRVFHGGFTAGFVRQALHAAGVRGHGGQGEHEPAPLALLALHPDLPAGKVHQHLADVQAKASAPGVQAAGAVLLVEPLEHVGQRFRADALTGIPDGDLGFRAFFLTALPTTVLMYA